MKRFLLLAICFGMITVSCLEVCQAGRFGRRRCRRIAKRHHCRQVYCPPQNSCDGRYCFEKLVATYYDAMGEFLYATYSGTNCPSTPFSYDSDACESTTTEPCIDDCDTLACPLLLMRAQLITRNHRVKPALLSGLPRLGDRVEPEEGVRVGRSVDVRFKTQGDGNREVYARLVALRHRGRWYMTGFEIEKPDDFRDVVSVTKDAKHCYVVKVRGEDEQGAQAFREHVVLLKQF